MSASATGRVIPFPTTRETALPLAELMARIDADLAAQRERLTDWRGTLACRRDVVGKMALALMDYRAELAELDARLVRLSRRARQLGTMARLAETEGVDDPFTLVPLRSRRD